MKQIAALTMVSLILGLGISTLDQWTAPEIAQSREEVRREAIQRVLPSDAETITVLPPASPADQPIYRSSLAGKETGFVYGIATKEGYNGTIRAWLAISPRESSEVSEHLPIKRLPASDTSLKRGSRLCLNSKDYPFWAMRLSSVKKVVASMRSPARPLHQGQW